MSSTKENQRPVTERRVFNMTNCEVRAATGETPAVFSGYAAVFNELSVNLGGFRERILPGAFAVAVDEGQDVRFLINHNADLVLGRTKAGTVTLLEDEIGLRVECELPRTSYAADLAESMTRGDIDQMSFGFVTRADAWPEKDAESGLPIRDLVAADLFDVSVVCYPAYTDTSAEIRSLIAEQNPELLERATRAAEELSAAEAEAEADEAEDEPETPETPETPAEPVAKTAEELRDEYEELRAEAGVRIEEGHPQCEGIAVVWNFNDELQSCHADRAAAEAQIEAMMSGAAGAARVGKTLSQKNAEAITEAAELLQTVLAAAGALEQFPPVVEVHQHFSGGASAELVRPDMAAFRAACEERGWGWEDDSNVWSLTQMIEAGSLFLLYFDDPNDDDAAEDAPSIAGMKAILLQLADLLAQLVAEGVREKPESERGEETPDEVGRFDLERRRLSLAEHELDLLAV